MSDLSPYLIERTPPGDRFAPFPHKTVAPVDAGIGIDELWRVIRRRLWLTAPLLLGTLVITALILFLTTPQYSANAVLLIEPETPQVLNMTKLLENSAGGSDYDYYKTQFALIKSRALAARVITTLQLEHNPLFDPKPPPRGSFADLWKRFRIWAFTPFHSKASPRTAPSLEYSVNPGVIDAYLGHLRVEPLFPTRLVTVSFTSPDPDLSARVVNAHAKDFIKQELEIRRNAHRTAEDFLKSQLTTISKRTEQAEAVLNDYRQRHGVLSFDVTDTNKVAAQRMSELTKALTSAETKRITAESEVALLERGDYGSLPQVVNNSTISALTPQLIDLESRYARLSASFKPTFPKMIELKAQLNKDRHAIAAQIHDIAGAVRRTYQAARAQEKQLRREIQAEKQRDLALNDALLKDSVLSREVQTNRDLYKNVLERMEEMSVAAQTPLSNVTIVQDAVPPRFASRPKKRLDLAITGVLAVLACVTLSFLFEQMDKRLKTPDEIESYLDLPSLALVPNFAKLAKPRLTIRRVLAASLSRISPPRPRASTIQPQSVFEEHFSGKGEVYRIIRTNILFSRAGSPPRTVLFTSSIEAEGKTWNAVNTAAAFARTGASTLLVSADLRRPGCDQLFDSQDTIGLSDALVGRCDPHSAIRRIDEAPLFFLSSGSRVPNPAELLTSARMRQVVDSLAGRYPFVVFDCAPLMHASESLALSTMVDGVLLVVGANTPKQNVRAARDRLSMVGAKVLGVLLNGVDIHRPDYREYTRYYYRYDELAGHDDERVRVPPA